MRWSWQRTHSSKLIRRQFLNWGSIGFWLQLASVMPMRIFADQTARNPRALDHFYDTSAVECWSREHKDLSDNSSDLATVHVVFSSTARGFLGLHNSMISVSRNLRPETKCIIHVLVPEEDMPLAEHLKLCFHAELHASGIDLVTVTLHILRPLPFGIRGRKSWVWPSASFAPFYIHKYLSGVTRAIYLDTDIVVKSDLATLYRIPMRYPLAAVRDYGKYGYVHTNPYYADRRHLFEEQTMKLFNSGVLLLDLRRWRAEGISDSLENLAKLHLNFHVQDLLQLQFQDKFQELNWRWNLGGLCWGFKFPKRCVDQAFILHWTGTGKPWNSWNNCTPNQEFYRYRVYPPGFVLSCYKYA